MHSHASQCNHRRAFVLRRRITVLSDHSVRSVCSPHRTSPMLRLAAAIAPTSSQHPRCTPSIAHIAATEWAHWADTLSPLARTTVTRAVHRRRTRTAPSASRHSTDRATTVLIPACPLASFLAKQQAPLTRIDPLSGRARAPLAPPNSTVASFVVRSSVRPSFRPCSPPWVDASAQLRHAGTTAEERRKETTQHERCEWSEGVEGAQLNHHWLLCCVRACLCVCASILQHRVVSRLLQAMLQ